MAAKASRRRADPGMSCGVLTIRCIGPGTKGDWRCGAKCSSGVDYGAVVNPKKGTARFYK